MDVFQFPQFLTAEGYSLRIASQFRSPITNFTLLHHLVSKATQNKCIINYNHKIHKRSVASRLTNNVNVA
jgi:hypothetical protein